MRPKATRKDKNHFIPRDFLRDRCGGFQVIQYDRTRAYTANFRGHSFILFDLSDYGGVFCDWLLFCLDSYEYRWLEVKTPEAYKKTDHDMTEGELFLMSIFGDVFRFVVTDDDMDAIMEGMI
jgi:hypothetical protein